MQAQMSVVYCEADTSFTQQVPGVRGEYARLSFADNV